MKRDTALWLVCMLVASVGLVASLWVVPYIPTADGPQHVLSAHIENHFSDAGSPYPDYYRVLPQYAGKGFSLVFGPLESMLPWRLALRLTLSLMALAFAWGFALVVLALDGARAEKRRPIAMLGFLIALPWALYMGFFAFVIGTTLGLYTLAFVLHRPPATAARHALLAFLLLLQGVCHVFTAILTGAVVAVLLVADAPAGARLRAVGRAALASAPAIGLLGLTFLERNMHASQHQPHAEWELGARASELSRWFVPGAGFGGWLVMGLVVGGLATTLLRVRRKEAVPATEQRVAWLGLALLLLTLLAPIHVPSWQLMAPRFALLAAVLGLALLRVPERLSPRAKTALVPTVTALCLGWDLASAKLHRDLATGCGQALAGLDAPLHFEGPRLPVILDGFCGAPPEHAESPVPWAAMAFNSNLLYLVDHGGVAAKLFNGAPSIHAIAFRGSRMPPPPDPRAQSFAGTHWDAQDPKLREGVLTELAANGMPFEGIQVVGGGAADFAVFTRRGYVPEYQNASLLIARYEGCPAELVLPAGALDRESVYFEYGLFSRYMITDEPRALAKTAVDRHSPSREDGIHVPLPGRPCGDVWLRVVWDTEGSSSFSPGDRACANAGPDGRFVATVSAAHPAVACMSGGGP
ncbi:MAG: hypothetical protein JWP87_2225 [Labilithrix sp.]|nr:hypothetical protein [Labilithrix sp.]